MPVSRCYGRVSAKAVAGHSLHGFTAAAEDSEAVCAVLVQIKQSLNAGVLHKVQKSKCKPAFNAQVLHKVQKGKCKPLMA